MHKRLLAVDLSNQVYRAAAAHSGLTSGSTFTGGVYGFLVALSKAVAACRVTDVVLCLDTKPYVRSTEYPQYKAFRKKSADEELLKAVQQSKTLVYEFADCVGMAVWGCPGFESDDLIGHVVRKYRHRFDWIYAMSNDEDLCQLMWHPRFRIYKGEKGFFGAKELAASFHGLTPEQYTQALAYMGTHNDVEGMPKVGPVTAAKAVRNEALARELRGKYPGVYERNAGLIALPHPSLPRSLVMPRSAGRYNYREFVRWASKYDINVTPNMTSALEQVL